MIFFDFLSDYTAEAISPALIIDKKKLNTIILNNTYIYLCWLIDFLTEYTSEAFKIIVWDSSSDGRALALHARGSGIDARLFHIFIFYLINKFLKKSQKNI